MSSLVKLQESPDQVTILGEDGTVFPVAKKDLGAETLSRIGKLQRVPGAEVERNIEADAAKEGAALAESAAPPVQPEEKGFFEGMAEALAGRARDPVAEAMIGTGEDAIIKATTEEDIEFDPEVDAEINRITRELSQDDTVSSPEIVQGLSPEFAAAGAFGSTMNAIAGELSTAADEEFEARKLQVQAESRNALERGAELDAVSRIAGRLRKDPEVKAARDRAQAQLKTMETLLRQPEQVIDPQRLQKQWGLGEKILAAFSIFASGLGQGLIGGPNMAIEMLERGIKRDIDAQRAQVEAGRREKSEASQLFRLLDANANNLQEANEGALLTILQQSELHLKSLATRLTEGTAKGRLDQFRAQLNQTIAQKKAAYASAILKAQQDAAKAQFERSKELREESRLSRSFELAGVGFKIPPTPEVIKRLAPAVENFPPLISRIKEMITVREKFKGGDISATNLAKGAQLRQAVLTMWRRDAFGVLQPGELALIKEMVADPTAVSLFASGKLDMLLKLAEGDYDAKLKAGGAFRSRAQREFIPRGN